MRRLGLLLIAVPALIAAGLSAESGTGDAPRDKWSVLTRTHAPRLSAIGDNVVRFSTSPSLGGGAYIFEIHLKNAEEAAGNIIFFEGHPLLGWKRTGSLTMIVSRAAFDGFTKRVDAALARGEPQAEQPDGTIIVCMDGPGYLTERRNGGSSQWLAGSCGDHPNDEIARLVEELVRAQFGRYLRAA